jgi:hypothetical protein
MATHRLSFHGLLTPDTSGNVFWQPSGILDTNDLAPALPVLIFKDTATLDTAVASFAVPKNYIGTAKVILRYKTTVTTGNVLWTVDHRAIAETETGDPTTWQESLAGAATAVPGTTNLLADISFTLTSANLAVDDTVLIRVGRNGAGADTAAASLQLLDATFEFADA